MGIQAWKFYYLIQLWIGLPNSSDRSCKIVSGMCVENIPNWEVTLMCPHYPGRIVYHKHYQPSISFVASTHDT